MRKEPKKIKIERPKRRGTAAPAERTLPDERKEEARRKCREPIGPDEKQEGD